MEKEIEVTITQTEVFRKNYVFPAKLSDDQARKNAT